MIVQVKYAIHGHWLYFEWWLDGFANVAPYNFKKMPSDDVLTMQQQLQPSSITQIKQMNNKQNY